MKVPSAKKQPNGTWYIQLRLAGESIYVTAPTEKECTHKAALIKAEHLTGKRDKKRIGLTLGDAIDNYISSRSNTLSPSTIRGYRTIRNHYFKDQMAKPIEAPTNWQQVINLDTALHSAKTIQNAWRFICSVMRENGIVPPRITLPQVVRNEHPFLQPEEIPVFISALKGKDCEIPALLALHSLRRSEIMALTWDKIDLKKGTISVSGSTVVNEHNELVQKKTNKNTASNRTLPIMIPELRLALESCETKTGAIVNWHPNVLYRRINKVCSELGFPAVGVHGLRHSFASLAYHLGLSEMETMCLGGWADTKTMHSIYTHLAAADRLKAENKLTAFFSGTA